MIKRVRHRLKKRLFFAMIPAMAGMLFFLPFARANDFTAGFFSGYYLRDLCASDEKGREKVKGGHTACQSYIAGVVDYHKLLKSLNGPPAIDICVPNTVPMKDLQVIVYAYLAKNAQHSDFIAAPAVTLALYDYFPCKSGKARKR